MIGLRGNEIFEAGALEALDMLDLRRTILTRQVYCFSRWYPREYILVLFTHFLLRARIKYGSCGVIQTVCSTTFICW